MNWYDRHAALVTFAGMFFWWASLVLYVSQRWEGIGVYLRGLFPALPLCLLLGWGIDRVGIIKSWRWRAAAGYGLNWLAQTMWLYSTKAACVERGIRSWPEGPFMLGAFAVSWGNLVALVIILWRRGHWKGGQA